LYPLLLSLRALKYINVKARPIPFYRLKDNIPHDNANNPHILKLTKNAKITVITIAIIMVITHITQALSQNVSYITFIIRRLTTIAIIKPTIQIPNQVKTEMHAEKVMSNNIVAPKAVSKPSSSSKNLAVRYNGKDINMKSRMIRTINPTISKPQKAILIPLNF
jgi:hypothetical protein